MSRRKCKTCNHVAGCWQRGGCWQCEMPHVAGSGKCRHEAWRGATKVSGTGVFLTGAVLLMALRACNGQDTTCTDTEVVALRNGGCTFKLACETGILSRSGSSCASVTALDLQDKGIYSMQTGIFLGMSSLESLNLGWNFLSSLSGDTFAGLSNLKQLYIYNNKLTALPDSIFLGLNKLEKLSLSGNIISYMPTAVYEQLKGYITRYYLGICSLLRSAVCY